MPLNLIDDIGVFKKPSVLETVKKHPLKTLLQPLPKTLGGLSPKEKLEEKFLGEIPLKAKTPIESFMKTFYGGIVGDIGDILTSPITYIPIPLGKVLGKIPIKGTTLGQVATKIPVGKGFVKGVKELGRYEQALKKLPLRVATSREPLRVAGVATDPVQKITQAIKEARPIRGRQEALYTIERAKRAGEIAQLGKQIPGEAGYRAQLSALKGKLPKVQFEGIRGKITQVDVDDLFNVVEQNQVLSPFEKITTKTGLAKLLGSEGGVVPTKGELSLLGEIFPRDFINTILTKRPLLEKMGQGIWEVLNVPRAIMASTDLSPAFRQGAFLIGRPKQFIPAFGNMFKYFVSEKAYQGLMTNIKNRVSYPLMKRGKLALTEIGASLTGREEAFMGSALAEKIPLAGKIVRMSNRAYTGFLNKLRADVFDDLIKSAQKQGLKVEGKLLNSIGNFVSTATGRGTLGALENASVALNTVLFSPRLMASRLNLLNPVYYIKLDPFVRKEALKSLFTFTGTAATVFSLAKMGGAKIGIDPRSADFGKIKIGNTRYDILGGFQQYIRAATQMITGEHISSTTGVKTTVGEGYKPLTRYEIATRFIETKEAPVMSFIVSLLKGQTAIGKEVDIPKEVGLRFTPMVIQDIYDLSKERGFLEGMGMTVPAIFGVGVQTYAPNASEMVYSANSVLRHHKELLEQGKLEEARNLLIKNREIIKIGKMLEPLQKFINTYKKLREDTKKNVRLTPQQKKQKISAYERKIKELQSEIEKKYEGLKTKRTNLNLVDDLGILRR